MKVKIRYNSSVPKLFGWDGITLYPFIFMTISKHKAIKSRLLHHEWIHILQVRKHGFFRFYFSYIMQSFVNILKYRNLKEAYRNISFEKEAYLKEKKIRLPKILN